MKYRFHLKYFLGIHREGSRVAAFYLLLLVRFFCFLDSRSAAGTHRSTAATFFVLLDCQELGGSPPEEVYEALLTGLIDACEGVLHGKEGQKTFLDTPCQLQFVLNGFGKHQFTRHGGIANGKRGR